MLCFSGSGDRREREARFKGCNKLAFICFSQRATKPNKHLPCPSTALSMTSTLRGCCDEVNQKPDSWKIYCNISLEYFAVCFNTASPFFSLQECHGQEQSRGCQKEKSPELFPPRTRPGLGRNTSGAHLPDKMNLLNPKIP